MALVSTRSQFGSDRERIAQELVVQLKPGIGYATHSSLPRVPVAIPESCRIACRGVCRSAVEPAGVAGRAGWAHHREPTTSLFFQACCCTALLSLAQLPRVGLTRVWKGAFMLCKAAEPALWRGQWRRLIDKHIRYRVNPIKHESDFRALCVEQRGQFSREAEVCVESPALLPDPGVVLDSIETEICVTNHACALEV